MKIIIYIALIFVMLTQASCADGDFGNSVVADVSSTSDNPNAIIFSCAEELAGTRAEGVIGNESDLKTVGFGVFACHHGQHPYSSSDISCNFMWNQKVFFNPSLGDEGYWIYEPVMYWPQGSGDEDNREYISFYAYAPYVEASESGCITDFSKNMESGDPWLMYQLGGSETSWKDAQVDLLYAFSKDQQQVKAGNTISTRVIMNFRHALSIIGEKVSFEASEGIQNRLKAEAAAIGGPVTLNITDVDLDYTLLRKGKLILNNSVEPNWKFVQSEDPLVHRRLSLPVSSSVLVTATSLSVTVNNNVTTNTDNGIFYIPLDVAGYPQTVKISAHYEVQSGSRVLYSGIAVNTIPLSVTSMDGRNQDLKAIISNELPGALPVLAPASGVSLKSALLSSADANIHWRLEGANAAKASLSSNSGRSISVFPVDGFVGPVTVHCSDIQTGQYYETTVYCTHKAKDMTEADNGFVVATDGYLYKHTDDVLYSNIIGAKGVAMVADGARKNSIALTNYGVLKWDEARNLTHEQFSAYYGAVEGGTYSLLDVVTLQQMFMAVGKNGWLRTYAAAVNTDINETYSDGIGGVFWPIRSSGLGVNTSPVTNSGNRINSLIATRLDRTASGSNPVSGNTNRLISYGDFRNALVNCGGTNMSGWGSYAMYEEVADNTGWDYNFDNSVFWTDPKTSGFYVRAYLSF